MATVRTLWSKIAKQGFEGETNIDSVWLGDMEKAHWTLRQRLQGHTDDRSVGQPSWFGQRPAHEC
ncbi:hypothetical protein CRENPOLYSF2_1600004 [Crenothrix polyspora]|uniref:Uncharacterized protein n=1 Tax=Crenothrix polyspora TaxID=360316 RepID=A0A1R4H2H0_9GAMM|nr:hypothetical protein CRENPOLYSF2_1600004 [Crenothrix polyspora]